MEEALIAHLLADAAIAAFAENRIFPVSLPQGSQLPAIVATRIDGGPLYADDGEVGLEDPRLQIDCWAATYTEAKKLARAVRARLSAFDGTVRGVSFQFIMIEDERDLRESGANAAEYRFRTSLDCIAWNES